MNELIWLGVGIAVGFFGCWNIMVRDFVRTRK